MFQQLKSISLATDAATRFSPASSYQFAAGLTTISVTRDEIKAVIADFTLVFSSDTPSYPVVLLGIDGRNKYVTEDGKWAASHVPARIALYPFASIMLDGQANLVRAVDAPHFVEAGGELLYQDGKESPVLETAISAAVRTHIGLRAAAAMAAQLEQAGLLGDGHLTLTLADGSEHAVSGFKVVNEAALAALDDATRAALESSGAMDLLIAHQQSLPNFARLLPSAKVKKVGKPRAAAKPRASAAKADTVGKQAAAETKAAKPAAAKKTTAKSATAAAPKASKASATAGKN